MKGPSMLNTALPLFIVTIIAVQCTALSPEETCKLVKNNTYIADPTNCQGWVLCVNNKALYGECAKGYLYDSFSGTCDYPEDVSCNVDRETMCEGLTAVYKADPNNCRNYCYCNEGVTYCAECPLGQVFDANSIKCEWEENSHCQVDSPCKLANNGFMNDGESCDGWLRCAGGQAVAKGKCPAGYLYNRNNGQCDYPQNVQCSNSPSPGPGPSTPGVPVSSPDFCKTKGKGFHDDDETCPGFFGCPIADGPGKWGSCPKGSHFSEEKQMCVDADQVVCTKDRCTGMTLPFMAVANTDCKEYIICKNGKGQTKGNCPADYPTFNEVAGVCQSEAVKLPICTQKVTTPK